MISAWQMPTYSLNPVQVSPPPGSLPSEPLPLLKCKLVVPLQPPTHFIMVIQFTYHFCVKIYWMPSTEPRHVLLSGPYGISVMGILALSFRAQPSPVLLKAGRPLRTFSLFVQRSFIFAFKISLKGDLLKWNGLSGERL